MDVEDYSAKREKDWSPKEIENHKVILERLANKKSEGFYIVIEKQYVPGSDTIIAAGGSAVRKMSREELEHVLSAVLRKHGTEPERSEANGVGDFFKRITK